MNTLHGLVDLKNTFVGRFLAVLVSFAMVLSCFNIAAFADDEQAPAAENPSAEQPAAGGADGSDDGAGAAVQDGADAQAPEPSSDGASSEAPEPSGGPSSEAGAETELGSAEGDAAVSEHETEAGLGEAVVSFEFDDNSYAKVAEQTIAFPQTSLKVVLHKDMEFIPAASTDYAVATVAAKSTASGEEIALIEKDGVYTVPADHVDSTLLIKVTSEKAAAENGDQPKADESPAALLIGSRAGDANTVRIAVGGSTTLEGAGVGAEAHEWFWKVEDSGDIYLQEILTINAGSPYQTTSLSITGKTLGTITLTHRWGTDDWGAVKSEQGRETFTIEVGQTGVGAEPTGLTSLKPSAVSLERFGTAKLKPVFEPESASASVAWSSSDSSIASVNRDGLVTAVNPGQATITAAVPGTDLAASAQVTVTESQAKGATAYFYVIRPDAHPGDLNNDSWLYVGKGSINVSNIKNTSGGPLKYNKKQYSLDVNNRVISYPDERDLKQVIADLYKVSYDEVTISFSPYKISYPDGAVGADGETPIASGPCYHVDMTVEIQTPQEASATYYLWDAGTSGYEPVENYVLDRGATTSPSGSYPEMKKGSDGTMYRFDGWYDNEARTGTPVSFPYAVEEGATFYAKYLAMPAYRVFYDGGADDVTSVPSDPDVYDVGARATVKAAPERLGYEFEGWVDAEGTVYQPGEQIIMPSDDVTLTALWTEHIEMVTLTYDANGGSGAVPDPVEIQPGTVVTQFASGEGLSNETATFKGWSESADGLVPVESLAMNGDKTLYAIWVDEYAIEYQVYTYANQESAVAPNFVVAQPENAPTTVEVKAGSISDDASAETVKAIAKLPDAVSYPEYGIGTQVIPGDPMADVEKAYYACELDNGAKKIIAKYENQVFVNELSDGAVGVRNLDPSYEDALRQGKITVRTHYVDASGEEVDHAKLSGDKTTVHTPALAETAAGTVTEELYFAWSQNDNKIDLLVTDTAADDGWVLNKVVHSGGNAWVRSAADGFQYIAVTGDTAVDIYLTPEYTVRYFETTADGSVELTDKTQVATSLMGSGMQNVLPSGIEATEALTVQPLPEKAGYRYTGWNTSADMSGTTVEAESQLDLASIDGATRTMNLYAESEPLLYEVAYKWTGLPSERLYDAEGAEIGTLVEPDRLTGLVIGDEYPIDDTYTDGYAVYTQDEFGNRTASYTFGGWQIDGTAVSGGQTMGDRNVLVTGRWVASPIPVPSHGVSYDWGTENVPGGVTLPAALEGLVPGRPYAVDTVYAAGYSVNERDEYGNVTGTYTFSGWHIDGSAASGERIMGDEDVAVTGSWRYEAREVAEHNVVYAWDLPENTTYYSEDGARLEPQPRIPASLTGLVKGERYDVDSDYRADATVVYTVDEYGNVNGSYTFKGWKIDGSSASGSMEMGDADVTVVGTWAPASFAVAPHEVSYSWTGLPTDGTELFGSDGNPAALGLPETQPYIKGQPYTVDSTYSRGTEVYTHDAYGNVNGAYTFEGWMIDGSAASGERIMGDSDVAVEGAWIYSEQVVVSYPVTYIWNLPADIGFCDAAGNDIVEPAVPVADPAQLVPGQTYSVDDLYVAGESKVYVRDEYGNVNGSYTFEGWKIKGVAASGEQTMGAAPVVIVGTWVPESIAVEAHDVSYGWEGLPADGTELFDSDGNPAALGLPATQSYVKGQKYLVDDAYAPGTAVYTHDAYGNVNGAYTFGGWENAGLPVSGSYAMGEEDVALAGVWTYSEQTVVERSIFYRWNLPEGVAYYDKAGGIVDVALPSTVTGLVKGQEYPIDTNYTDGYEVYTKDEYGNVNGSYTFEGWKIDGSSAGGSVQMADTDVTVVGTWVPARVEVEAHEVSYGWMDQPAASIEIFDADGNPATLELPATQSYVRGQPYTVDSTYSSGTAVYTHDEHGNVTGAYTFSGWTDPGNRVMGEEDIIILGTWIYSKQAVVKHDVTYEWENLPENTTFYTAAGSQLALTKPASMPGMAPNQFYNVDATFPPGFTVYTRDAYGNVNASYTFGGWMLEGEQVGGTTRRMGSADVNIEGTWTEERIPVPSHGVSYDWGTENVPGGVTLPAALEGLVPGRPYAVDTVYAAGYSVNERDEYGNVTGTYTFSGWHIDGSAASGERIMGDEDVAVTGSWSYAEQTVARYNVVYGWDLPDNAYYDAAGTAVDPTLPASLTGLVNGQPYTIDALFAQGAVVYTHDENGNRSGSYTFGGWSDPGNGVMGEADVLVSGAWVYEAIAVPLPVPTPVPTPTTPDTPIANALPPAVTAPIDAAAQALQNTYETVIGEEPTPLAGPAEETISDNDTPLAGGFDAHDPACWVHFYIILGMILSALYVIAVVARRRRFITVLNGYEDSLFGRDGNRGGKGVA